MSPLKTMHGLGDFVIPDTPGGSLRLGPGVQMECRGVWREVQPAGGSLGGGVMVTARVGRFTENAPKCTQANLLVSQTLHTEAKAGGARLESGGPAWITQQRDS